MKGLLPIKFKTQGGANYSICWNMRWEYNLRICVWDTAYKTLAWKRSTNVVYLTLLGDDRWNQDTTKIPKWSRSPKLLAEQHVRKSNKYRSSWSRTIAFIWWGKTIGEALKDAIWSKHHKLWRSDVTTCWCKQIPKKWYTHQLEFDNKDKTINTKVEEFDIDNDGRKDMLIRWRYPRIYETVWMNASI